MERVGGGAGEAGGAAAPPPVAAGEGGGTVKGKSCKGCLFYSSVLRSRERGPVCAGITRTIPQGYSMYLDDKESSKGKGDKHAQLPICVGIELLADRRTSTNQASAHRKKEAPQGPQPRQYKPGHRGDDFLTKFQRSAGLVANGVARNINKVGAYIKDTMDDIMYPYRKRPK
ncbi:hypothetical protein E2562_029056 [Oryza meyeriana var. granulata]|uniref:DUF8204 domain-containing protein n=1 Tax=Oryza meyeriana var. granulata TaxID=110450 RepID=A0A6G1CVV4_9ORYZ|nr:hypothetical protein E2562_029056 [Oryza meyeriana var. granulata]